MAVGPVLPIHETLLENLMDPKRINLSRVVVKKQTSLEAITRSRVVVKRQTSLEKAIETKGPLLDPWRAL